MSDYAGIVCTINTREFPGKDRIQLGDALGYQVVIGKDVQPGDLGVLFPPDGQLSEEFCAAHNLLRRDGGYVGDNRRVVAQRFAGVRSEAFWVPSHYLYYFAAGKPDVDNLRVGERITTFAGVPICNKWINPNTQRARQGTQRQGRARPEWPWFRGDYDAEHLRDAAVGDPAFLSDEQIAAPIVRRRGGGLHVGRVTAGVRFGQRERADPFSTSQFGQILRLLLFVAEKNNRPRANRMMRVDEQRRAAAVPTQHFQ